MTLFKDKYRVETNRLEGWDYGAAGYYFVTICTHDRACFLGEICDGDMKLSPQGIIVAEEWQQTETMRNNVALDAWVIMPNHFHAIIALNTTPVETPPLARLDVTSQRGETCQRHVSTDGNYGCRRDAPVARLGVTVPYREETPHRGVSMGLKSGSLGAIINQFKSVCTKRIRAAGHDFGWQARYFDRIIRDDRALHEIREYIVTNPLKWEMDKNHPKNM
jgi:REP element-mobilizing transposase RayT